MWRNGGSNEQTGIPEKIRHSDHEHCLVAIRVGRAERRRAHQLGRQLQYSTDHLFLPKTVQEVQQAVKSCTKLKALGARHSFNGIADSTENQISLKQLDQMTWTKHLARSQSERASPTGNWRLYRCPGFCGAQFGLVAARFGGRRLRDCNSRFRQQERQPVHGDLRWKWSQRMVRS